MIISPKYKFVFIAPEKTGATSIHGALEKIEDDNLIVGKLVGDDNTNLNCKGGVDATEPHKYKHSDCERSGNFLNSYSNYFKFAFVRNPWDRVVSWYCFEKNEFTNKKRDLTNVNFAKYIRNYENIWAHGFQCESTKCCDFIGKFENLQQDFDIICDKVGIPQRKLPHKNATKHKHYTEYYDEETKQIVAERYAKDIEYFNYKFGE